MRQVAILAAVFSMAILFAMSSPKAQAAPIQTTTKNTIKVSSTPTPPPVRTVTVQPGDTLSQLAIRFGSTILRLFYANTEIKNPNLIYPGEQLRIPSSDERLTARTVPGALAAVVQPTPQQSTSESTQTVATPAPTVVTPSIVTPPSPPVSAVTSTTSSSVWDSLAMCESSGNWSIDTGNGFYGGLQFTLQSWQAVGGTGYPNDASPAEQIAMAEKLLAIQGWEAWPACSLQLGLR
jgi:LysM repeat protein